MRMWNVDPECLCQKHLLGEHVETHMFVGCINKDISLDGYVQTGLVEVHNIVKRHNELVAEMTSRGMNHQSPLSCDSLWEAGEVDAEANRVELARRCADCAKRLGASRE